MPQEEKNRIPQELLGIASRFISKPEMQESFALGKRRPELLHGQLDELEDAIEKINMVTQSQLSPDMVNVIKLKDMLQESGGRLPLILDERTQKNRDFQNAYRTMLREGDKLLGPYFHFHTQTKDPEERLGLAVLDGYGLFIPFMMSQSPQEAKKTQEIVVNALCETLAEMQLSNPNVRISLFHYALDAGWYNPEYGFSEKFTQRLLQKGK